MSLTLNGSAGVTTNSGAVYDGLQSGTAVASTSGTSIDFTSIPSWVKRITVMFSGVSTSGTSAIQVQIGTSGGIQTSGYASSFANTSSSGANAGTAVTTGFAILIPYAAANTAQGQFVISLLDSSSGIWVGNSLVGQSGASSGISYSAFNKTLSGTLDRVRITTVNGTDTFDAGTINIIYE